MSELVERYIHQVGRYLPKKDRAEIEAELRSQIHDQLDDRYAGTPTQEEVATLLKEFGHPYQIATSYQPEQYLVGPMFYPYMMMVMRYGWVLVPMTVAFLNLFDALVSPPAESALELVVQTLLSAIQATLSFSAVVVLIFAIIQRANLEMKDKDKESAFNPLELPSVNDPRVVDRLEGTFGLAIGTIFTLVLLYWLQVGGLTLRFNLSDPGEVIPFPIAWMLLLLLSIVGQVVMQLLILRSKYLSVGLLLSETVLELFGVICLYFAVFEPFFTRPGANPDLADLSRLIAIILAVSTLLNKGAKLVTLWNYSGGNAVPLKAKRSA